MKTGLPIIRNINGITWSLSDEELAEALSGYSHPPGERRHFGTYPFRGGRIFIKSFAEKGFLGQLRKRLDPRGKREYMLGQKLRSLSITTPVVFGYGIGPENSAVIQEWISGGSFMETFANIIDRSALLISLAGLLRALKEKHVLHNDLHLNNVLLSDDGLYLIDLHKMAIKRTFTTKDEMGNLSHALAMIYRSMSDEERNIFFRHYGNDTIRGDLEKTLKTMHLRWIKRKQDRAFRDTSHILHKGDYFFIKGRESRGHGGYLETIKKDKKVIVERFDDHIRKTYVHERRLKRAWRAHVAIEYLDIHVTPETYCVKTSRKVSPGFICMEDLGRKGEELDRYLDRAYDSMNIQERRAFASNLANFIGSAARSTVAHRDLKGCNVFALEDGTFRFLDAEDIFFKDMDREIITKMLSQLNTSVPKRIGLLYRIRFVKELAGVLDIDAGQTIRDVARLSSGKEIVYEGAGGLKREVPDRP